MGNAMMAREKVLLLALVCCLLGCRGEAKPPSFDEITAERMALPALFITTSRKHLKAPSNSGAFVDESSREIAWPAYACHNPACPGRKPDGQMCLFAWQDPRFFVTPEGTLGMREFATIQAWREAVDTTGGHREPTCPECLKTRKLATETAQQREQFSQFVRRYELPEVIARRVELDALWQARKKYIERRTQQP